MIKFKEMDFNALQEYLISDACIEEWPDDEEEMVVENEEFGEKDFVLLFNPVYRVMVAGRTFLVVEGVYMAYDEEIDGTYPEWDISLVYENVPDDEFDPNNFLYYEQGSAASAVMNYRNILMNVEMNGG
mgnify:CR=1 FL=1